MTVLSRPETLTSASGPSGRRRGVGRQRWVGYLFIAPFVIAFVAVLVVPICYAFGLSLFRNTLVGGQQFSGIGNYLTAFADPDFWSGVGRVVLVLIVQVPIMLVLSLAFALALDAAAFYAMRFTRLAIFLPYAIPGVVSVLVWGYLYGGNYGLITQTIHAAGLPAPDLLDSGNILGSIMNIITWQYAGYNMIILYAALRAVPGELSEAATVDGAGRWRIAWSIKVPAIRSALILCAIFSSIGAFQVFTEPTLLHNLAPTVIIPSFTPAYYAYNAAFLNHDLGYAAALAFLLGLVVAVASYVVQLISRRGLLR